MTHTHETDRDRRSLGSKVISGNGQTHGWRQLYCSRANAVGENHSVTCSWIKLYFLYILRSGVL